MVRLFPFHTKDHRPAAALGRDSIDIEVDLSLLVDEHRMQIIELCPETVHCAVHFDDELLSFLPKRQHVPSSGHGGGQRVPVGERLGIGFCRFPASFREKIRFFRKKHGGFHQSRSIRADGVGIEIEGDALGIQTPVQLILQGHLVYEFLHFRIAALGVILPESFGDYVCQPPHILHHLGEMDLFSRVCAEVHTLPAIHAVGSASPGVLHGQKTYDLVIGPPKQHIHVMRQGMIILRVVFPKAPCFILHVLTGLACLLPLLLGHVVQCPGKGRIALPRLLVQRQGCKALVQELILPLTVPVHIVCLPDLLEKAADGLSRLCRSRQASQSQKRRTQHGTNLLSAKHFPFPYPLHLPQSSLAKVAKTKQLQNTKPRLSNAYFTEILPSAMPSTPCSCRYWLKISSSVPYCPNSLAPLSIS